MNECVCIIFTGPATAATAAVTAVREPAAAHASVSRTADVTQSGCALPEPVTGYACD